MSRRMRPASRSDGKITERKLADDEARHYALTRYVMAYGDAVSDRGKPQLPTL